MDKRILPAAVAIAVLVCGACNDGLTGSGGGPSRTTDKVDKSRRTVIDASPYTDFTVKENDALKIGKNDVLFALGNGVFRNGGSFIRINRQEMTVEIGSDSGFYEGKGDRQVYGRFGFDVGAASGDCLYIRRDLRTGGMLIIDNVTFIDDRIPDVAVCIPLYGYSRNRIEVSPVMNGFIIMPSGTYWRK